MEKNKSYPKTIFQALLFLFFPLLIVAPIFALKEVIHIPLNYLFNIFFIIYFFALFLFYKYKNNDVKFDFAIKSNIFPFIIFISSFQIAINIPFTLFFARENFFSTNNYWFLLISFLLLSPIIEEFIFRGMILKNFLKNYSKNKAILLSTLLFVFIHLNYIQFLGSLFLGILVGYYFYYTKSVGVTILMHFVMNFIGVLGVFFNYRYGKLPVNSVYDIYGNYSIFIIITSFLIMLYVMYYIIKNKEQIINKLKQLDAPQRLPI